jgi:hypothetical protein
MPRHSSPVERRKGLNYRDAIQFSRDIFDHPISLGTVASIVDGWMALVIVPRQ